MRRYWVPVLLIGVFATGCVKQQIALTPENAGKVTSSTVILVVGQEELEAEVEQSNIAAVTGGGLLPALIDAAIENSRSKSAEKLVSPLRASLSGINVRKELAAKLENQLNNSWLHIEKIETTSVLTSEERNHLFRNRQGNAVMVIDAKYKLTPDFTRLNISASDEVYLKDVKDPIYKDNVSVSSDSISVKSKENAAAVWGENKGVKLRMAIHDGIKRLAESIALKLALPAKAATAAPVVTVN